MKNRAAIRLIAAAAAAGILLSCTGCLSEQRVVSPNAIETREVRDDLDRAVKVPVSLTRAVSLAPSLTEMIFAVGAGDRLVGVTTYCNYPAETAAIDKVGDTQTPNLERIIALKPQVVFVSTASQLEAFTKTLEDQGIAVYVSSPKNLDEVFKDLKQLGDIFGRAEQANDLVGDLERRLAVVRNDVARSWPEEKTQNRPKVFVQISEEPLFTIGKDSFLTELVREAGGVSVTGEVPSAYPKLSKETAAALDPDTILLSDSEDNVKPSAAFKNSKAVRNGRVFRINADILSRPGPRLVDVLEQMARTLKVDIDRE